MNDACTQVLKEIAHRLHIGESTLNVWRKRYEKWIPESLSDDPAKAFDVFRLIHRCTNAGFDNYETLKILMSVYDENQGSSFQQSSRDVAHDNGLKETLSSLKELMTGIASQQSRIAEAHERRAAAQERMAYAMESRAESDMIRTGVMRDLVLAIQDLSASGAVNSMIDHVKSMTGPSVEELVDFSENSGFDIDDLEELTLSHEYEVSEEPFNDLSEITAESVNESEVFDKNHFAATRDDYTNVDDLSELLEPGDENIFSIKKNVDDLSLLLEEDHNQPPALEADDLSKLLEPGDENAFSAAEDVDDLSLLIDKNDVSSEADIDNLALLVDDEPETVHTEAEKQIRTQTSVKADVSDKGTGKEDYKSKILKKIIYMKRKEGLSVEQTTDRLNSEGFKTLSGKGKWDLRTVQGIYSYIDSFS